MRIVDAGHKYALAHLDDLNEQLLVFVKREGPNYPGNSGHYPGTNLQEVLRVCIDRVQYLDAQIPCIHNKRILSHLRDCIRSLEERAAERHKRKPDWRLYDPYGTNDQIEHLPTCASCGHIGCKTHNVQAQNVAL